MIAERTITGDNDVLLYHKDLLLLLFGSYNIIRWSRRYVCMSELVKYNLTIVRYENLFDFWITSK